MHVLQIVEHVNALKTSFLQKNYLHHALLYLEPKHGLLASTFKVLIVLPLVINWPGMEEHEFEEDFFGDEHAN